MRRFEPRTGPVGSGRSRAIWRSLQILPLVALATVSAWNLIGPLPLGEVHEGYIAQVREGRFDGQRLGPRGALTAVAWVESRATLAWNPLRILYQQLWYNAYTEGYDLVLWLEPASGDLSQRQFAIYQKKRTIFLRVEFEGRNRVFDVRFTPQELEAALEPFLVPPGALEALPAERR